MEREHRDMVAYIVCYPLTLAAYIVCYIGSIYLKLFVVAAPPWVVRNSISRCRSKRRTGSVPRVTVAEQIRRNQRIVRDRARGYTWATVVEQNDVTARRARQVVREYPDPLKLHPVAEYERIDEAIDFTVQALEDLPTLAEPPRNDPFKLTSRLKPLE